MDANDFRQFYAYHFAENRKIWDTWIMSLTQEQFVQPLDYSIGSVRNQLVHMMSADNYWFGALRRADVPDWFNPDDFNDRSILRTHWDAIEQVMRDYLAGLRDEMLSEHPFPGGGDEKLILWQVLLHVTNHGTDHRAQLLRSLHDLGLKTAHQDYIFYLFDNM